MKLNFSEKLIKKKSEETEGSLPIPKDEIQKEKQKELSTLSENKKIEEKKREEILSETPEEKILKEGEIKEVKPLCPAVYFVKIKDNGSAIFKSKDKESVRTGAGDARPGTLFKRERAAYLVDKFLRFDLVPPTIIRRVEDMGIGSMQQFIKAKSFSEISENEKNSIQTEKEELIKLWIFDYIIWNLDRRDSNILTKKNKIYAIDHGYTLGKGNLICNKTFFDTSIPKDIIKTFEKFLEWNEGKKILRNLLRELLNKKEASACMQRIEKIGKLIHQGEIPSSKENELTFK